jgi:hypothetical protein
MPSDGAKESDSVWLLDILRYSVLIGLTVFGSVLTLFMLGGKGDRSLIKGGAISGPGLWRMADLVCRFG